MSFGLINEPTGFMNLMNGVFKSLDLFIIVFIGDIFVYSKREAKHEARLYIILKFSMKK